MRRTSKTCLLSRKSGTRVVGRLRRVKRALVLLTRRSDRRHRRRIHGRTCAHAVCTGPTVRSLNARDQDRGASWTVGRKRTSRHRLLRRPREDPPSLLVNEWRKPEHCLGDPEGERRVRGSNGGRARPSVSTRRKQLVADKRLHRGQAGQTMKRNGTRNSCSVSGGRGDRASHCCGLRTSDEVAGRRGIPSYKNDTAGAGQPQHSQAVRCTSFGQPKLASGVGVG